MANRSLVPQGFESTRMAIADGRLAAPRLKALHGPARSLGEVGYHMTPKAEETVEQSRPSTRPLAVQLSR